MQDYSEKSYIYFMIISSNKEISDDSIINKFDTHSEFSFLIISSQNDTIKNENPGWVSNPLIIEPCGISLFDGMIM